MLAPDKQLDAPTDLQTSVDNSRERLN